jgi:hypothetical protein
MEAAAHTPGGFGGVPQSVGKEFVSKDRSTARELRAALKEFLTWIMRAEPAEETALRNAITAQDTALALDAESVRSYDADGRLHISKAHLSKANVCGYLGREINAVMQDEPGWVKLPDDQIFRLLRDPKELAKAAPTFNGIQLLIQHIPVSADDPQKEEIVGTTGTNAQFNAPYLDNELIIWSKDGIDAVESDAQKELSAGYRYKAVMQPGEYNGEHYDGRMVDIVGNHIALVKKGRAGPDVVVGDSAILETRKDSNVKSTALSRTAARVEGALCAYLASRGLALDAMPDFKPILAGVTAKNFKTRLPMIWKGVMDTVRAVDADQPGGADPADMLRKLLDLLAAQSSQEEDEPDAAPLVNENEEDEEDENAAVKEFLRGRLSPEDHATVCQMLDDGEAAEAAKREGADETPEEAAEHERKGLEPNAGVPAMKPKGIDKKAMDAAIQAAAERTRKEVLAQQRAIRMAEIAVRPYIGDLAVAQDSAEAVYKLALDTLGVKTSGVHPSAYPAMLAMLPKPGEKPTRAVPVGMDAAASDDLAKRFPGAARINLA